ncbi:hypothetical protein B0H63DRAFT_454404 [Podospora didyma]|uniref:HypA protein n=1 Tax=Podospora didyma TaxID=330526 RepID=A0AAE0N5I2_9PEZI|nr:hypothetical protein B0H63DRAFT_454404 [Podospora didyma]
MATAPGSSPYLVRIVPEDSGLWKVPQTEVAAKLASDLLQEDLEKHHVYFNQNGFHNHIPHHILALYGTGAGPDILQKGYDDNANYQRPALKPHDRIVDDLMKTWSHAQKYLGKDQYYPDFLRFFQKEMDARSGGWSDVVAEYLLNDDDMLARLFAGFLHPLIQLMYGMEWKQPAIVAEALAQTAVHGNDLKGFLLESERLAAAAAEEDQKSEKMPAIVELLEAIGKDENLAKAARMEDGNKIRDGVLVRAREDMIRVASRVRVRPDELDERTAEMFDACVYMAAAAAVHPSKVPKFDFFLMHHVNSSPIFLTINAQPWISAETKARLLEWKIRMDLIQYTARGVPALSLDKIASYKPKKEEKTPSATISDIITRRLHPLSDDGHAIKLGRAALICHDLLSRKYGDRDWVKIRGDDPWNKVAHLIVDSVEAPGETWVRSCGFEEAWKDMPDAQDAKL